MASGAVFGMINALRTGNPAYDMAICMAIPMIFSGLTHVFQRLGPWLLLRRDWWFGSKYHTRKILFEQVTNHWGEQLFGKDERNNILQKAISLYMSDQKLTLKRAKISLMAVKEKTSKDGWRVKYGDTAEALKAYNVNLMPPDNEFVEIADGVEFMRRIEENQEGEKDAKRNKRSVEFIFISKRSNGMELIDSWIDKAYNWYIDEVAKTTEKGRYMYNLFTGDDSPSGEESKQNKDVRKYKRYLLSDHKTFDSLFFKEKELLLKILGNFENKTGKYAISGYPHKLGLLLHGPPGTGKTSLIKAMAQCTKRNIINVPLSRIETNQHLMDIVFDQTFQVVGEELPVKLSFEDTIFVMEDIDAASKIVHSREKRGAKAGVPAKTTVTVTKEISTINEAGEEEVSKEKESSMTGKEDEKAKGTKTKITREITVDGKSQTAAEDEADSEDEEEKAQAAALGGTGNEETDLALATVMSLLPGEKGPVTPWKSSFKKDKLDLAGLLNVLDGVVDCPNRIVIMTSNHPEKLDAALIRPGRIDKKIYLGYMEYTEACQMIEHYFQCSLTDKQKLDIEMIFDAPPGAANFTPAMIEQFCAEYEEVEDFIKALSEKVQPLLPGDMPMIGRQRSHLS